jgi:hypothetical protein
VFSVLWQVEATHHQIHDNASHFFPFHSCYSELKPDNLFEKRGESKGNDRMIRLDLNISGNFVKGKEEEAKKLVKKALSKVHNFISVLEQQHFQVLEQISKAKENERRREKHVQSLSTNYIVVSNYQIF